MSLRVCCIDDSPLCLHGLRQSLTGVGYEIVAEINHLEDLEKCLTQYPCDVIISEIRLAGLDLFETCSDTLGKYPKSKLIAYSYDENPTHIARASAIDAWDYVPKRYSVQRLIQSCESIQSGQRHPDSLITITKKFLLQHHKPADSIPIPLTKREYQVLIHLSLGLSNREISKSLSISLETVKEHVQNILRKLKINDRTAAAIWSLKQGVPTLSFDTPIPNQTQTLS
ncbi:MAG: LuxR C-terminal-related transcriptional regulator [Planctomycetota bacterium]|jgi:DNA-binding NarL/FixJ family response regulator